MAIRTREILAYSNNYIIEHRHYEMLVIGPTNNGEHWTGYLSELNKFDYRVKGIVKKRGHSDGVNFTISH